MLLRVELQRKLLKRLFASDSASAFRFFSWFIDGKVNNRAWNRGYSLILMIPEIVFFLLHLAWFLSFGFGWNQSWKQAFSTSIPSMYTIPRTLSGSVTGHLDIQNCLTWKKRFRCNLWAPYSPLIRPVWEHLIKRCGRLPKGKIKAEFEAETWEWRQKNGSGSRIRTYDQVVNSHLLYRWAMPERCIKHHRLVCH